MSAGLGVDDTSDCVVILAGSCSNWRLRGLALGAGQSRGSRGAACAGHRDYPQEAR